MRFAVDPTEGNPRDYSKGELDRTTMKPGSSSDSSDCLESKKKLQLWDKLVAQSKQEDDLEEIRTNKPEEIAQGSKPKGTAQASKLEEKEIAQASKPKPWQATNREPAESSYEEDNTDPDSPDVPMRTWVIFESEDEPFPLDQLSPGHEMMLENGKRHRFVDIQESNSIKEGKMMREKDKKDAPVKDEKNDSTEEEPAPRKINKIQIKENDARPPGNPFDEKGRLIRTLD